MENNGSFKQQGLKNRLKAVHDNKARKIYFQEVIKNNNFNKLKFLWFVTFDTKNQELPVLSEAKFIQAYYDEFKKLPLLNKSV